MRRVAKDHYFSVVFIPTLLVTVLVYSPTVGGNLSLNGNFIQGGLVIGRTDPGTQITLLKRVIRVDNKGTFIFGFSHDDKKRYEIFAVFTDGSKMRRQINVKQRNYVVQRIDGLPRRMVNPAESDFGKIRHEAKLIHTARSIFTLHNNFSKGLILPVKGKISGIYGSRRILNGRPRRPHLGLDIAAPAGTTVIASADGAVTLAERDLYFTGGTVIVDHGHGLSTVYSHLRSLFVGVGDRVTQAQKIGLVGSTGRSTGPHLDWRVNWFQTRLDPMLLVNSNLNK